MEEAEALACFERGLSLICSGRARELVCMRLPRSGEGTFIMPHEAVAPAAPDGAAEHMLRVLPVLPQQPPAVTGAEAQETFIRHAVRAVLVTLRTMNVLSAEAATPGDAAARAGIMPGFTRWLAEALRMLSEHGLAEETSRGYRLTAEGRALDAGEVDMQWRAARAEAGRDPGIAPMVALLSRCMDNLSAVLGGRVRATEQVFPAGEVGALGNVYEGNDWSDFFNGQLAGAVTRLAEDVVRREPARRLRIAEVGAGTGSTTRAVIAALEAQGASADYLYTDVSAAFTAHGRAAFGAGRPWMEFHVWNIDGAALPGAIAPGSCDIVIATNVLHATPDIRRALRNAKAALRPGGVLLLNETVWKTVFATLTFGLLDGWWAFADADLRIPGAPLLSGAQWLSVLEEEGFAPARLLTAPVRSAAQCVIAAQSDGWRLLPRLAEAAPPSAPGPRPVSQSMPQPAPAVAPASASFAAPDHAGVRQALAACLGEALNIAAAQIDGSVAFSEYGVDSIVGAQLVSLISRRLGIPLNASALYEHANLDALSRHLAAALAEAAGPHRVESPPSAPRPLTLEERFMAGELSAASLLEEIA
jgi:SAM-dependent methyltransferase/acyl carrier protein